MELKPLLEKLKNLSLAADQYAIIGGAAMAARGIVNEVNDLDVVVKNKTYEELAKKNGESEPGHIKIDGIEIFSAWNSLVGDADSMINRAEEVEGFRYIRLQDLITWKTIIGRPKDFKDIDIIKQYLFK